MVLLKCVYLQTSDKHKKTVSRILLNRTHQKIEAGSSKAPTFKENELT